MAPVFTIRTIRTARTNRLSLEAAMLILGVLAAGCEGDTTKYVDPGKTFELHYPNNWVATNEAGAAVFAEAGSGPGASFVVTRVPKNDGPIVRTEVSVLENVMTQYKALPGFAVRRSEKATLAGLKVHGLSVVFDLRGVRYRKDQYVIPLKQHLLVVDCNAPASAFDKALFAQLLDQLEVIG